MINPKTVYVKSAKGQEEVDKRTYKLPLKLRSLLIMINGKVSAGEIIEYGGSLGGGMDVLLGQLLEGGFIEPAQPPAALLAASSPVPAPAPSSDRGTSLLAAKNAIKKLVYDQLGPDADMVVGKLEKCESRLQLVAYCDTCKDIVEAALGKTKGQALWVKAKESIETAFAGVEEAAAAAPQAAPAAMPRPVSPPAPKAAAPAVAPQPASSAGSPPRKEVDQWIFEKARGEISRLVFDTLGPDGEMMAMKIEKTVSMSELKGLMEKTYEVVRGVRGKQKAEDTRTRIEGLIAAVEGN